MVSHLCWAPTWASGASLTGQCRPECLLLSEILITVKRNSELNYIFKYCLEIKGTILVQFDILLLSP